MALGLSLTLLFLFLQTCQTLENEAFQPGPLRVSADNPAYFTNNSGKAIYLTGAHTWNNLVDMVTGDSAKRFNYSGYLTWMKQHNYNFFRLWAWELLNWDTRGNNEENPLVLAVFPHPWARTGPGNGLDGKPKFDLETFDPAYFKRLKERVQLAEESEIYVAVMLFEGWGLQFSPGAYESHPFHPENNINGIDGDVDGDNSAIEIHEMANEEVLAIQETYAREVIETVNKFDFVLFEIANECQSSSTDWQYHMVNFIKDYEKQLPKQHPVGMTFQYQEGSNQVLFNSPADWISPNREEGYIDNPPAASGIKVVITDTDHLWGIGGNQSWVWKSFLRGLNPIFMDPYDRSVLTKSFSEAWVAPLRKALGDTRKIADSIDLIRMFPHSDLVSTEYCLAKSGEEYLVYLSDTVAASLDLTGVEGNFNCSWFDTNSHKFSKPVMMEGGQMIDLISPFDTENSIAYLKKR